MTGKVDEYGRALLEVTLYRDAQSPALVVPAWIDTGFTGDMMLPRALVSSLGLPKTADVTAGLGDGKTARFDNHEGLIDWFGERRTIDVLANEGKFPLLGVRLLAGHFLSIDYEKCTVELR